MKNTWNAPDLEVLDMKETAFGPMNPTKEDSEKTQITINGVTGWQTTYGEASASSEK